MNTIWCCATFSGQNCQCPLALLFARHTLGEASVSAMAKYLSCWLCCLPTTRLDYRCHSMRFMACPSTVVLAGPADVPVFRLCHDIIIFIFSFTIANSRPKQSSFVRFHFSLFSRNSINLCVTNIAKNVIQSQTVELIRLVNYYLRYFRRSVSIKIFANAALRTLRRVQKT